MGAAAVAAAGAGALALPYLPLGDAMCPTVGYSVAVEARLDDAWPDREGLQLDLRWPDGDHVSRATGTPRGPVWQGSATSVPPTADVVVTRSDDVVHTGTATFTPRVVARPHGPRCPGPTVAEAVVPPPTRP